MGFSLLLLGLLSGGAPAFAQTDEWVPVVTLTQGVFDFMKKPRAEARHCLASGMTFESADTYVAYVKHQKALRTGIPLDEAKRLLNELRNDPDLAFDYPENGCQARATLMARKLEAKNIYSRKIYIAGNLKPKNECIDPKRGWDQHVAPLVTVKMPDGRLVDMMFDPSLGRDPLPVPQWQALMAPHCSPIKPSELKPMPSPPDPRCRYIITSRFVGGNFPESSQDLRKHRDVWDDGELLSAEMLLRVAKANGVRCVPAPKP